MYNLLTNDENPIVKIPKYKRPLLWVKESISQH
jgi:hypothetical protein